ncbi:MAG TPA: hypothetical protein VJR89_05280 [Polyangiales bacterium]|nr:hypothetical protein [Polyangiales bacterium]
MLLCALSVACNELIGNSEVSLRPEDAASDAARPDPPEEAGMVTMPREDARVGAPDVPRPDASSVSPDAAAAEEDAGVPVCTAGETETRQVDCGRCNRGRRVRSRVCSERGRWGAWQDSAVCNEVGIECSPNEEQQLAAAPCGPCNRGVMMPKRVCSPLTCTWQPASGECQVPETVCMPGARRELAPEPCGACLKGRQVPTQECHRPTCTWAAPTQGECTYSGGACDPNADVPYRCRPPRDPRSGQAYREWCDEESCTYGADDRERCGMGQCPECYE